MKIPFLILALAIGALAQAAPADLLQSCTTLVAGTTSANGVIGCPRANLFWGPKTTTDLVRTQNSASQLWLPYSQLLPDAQVVLKSTGTWAKLSSITVMPAPTPALSTPPNTGTPIPVSGRVTLHWDLPTLNSDNTPLTDLKSFHVYQGTSISSLVKIASVGPSILLTSNPPQEGPPTTVYTTPTLAPGTYYFMVTAVNAANQESTQSGIVSAVIVGPAPAPAKTPGTPTNLKITVEVIAGP